MPLDTCLLMGDPVQVFVNPRLALLFFADFSIANY